jgi:hypothetical protein
MEGSRPGNWVLEYRYVPGSVGRWPHAPSHDRDLVTKFRQPTGDLPWIATSTEVPRHIEIRDVEDPQGVLRERSCVLTRQVRAGPLPEAAEIVARLRADWRIRLVNSLCERRASAATSIERRRRGRRLAKVPRNHTTQELDEMIWVAWLQGLKIFWASADLTEDS